MTETNIDVYEAATQIDNIIGDDIESQAEVESLPQDLPEAKEQEVVEDKQEYFTIEIKGKTFEVPAELKDNFLMQSDYTKKTTELAEQRRVISEKVQVLQQAEQIQQRLGYLENLLGDAVKSNELTPEQQIQFATENPAEYVQWKAQQDLRKSELERITAEKTRQEQDNILQSLNSSMEQLQAKYPDWKDEKVFQEVQKSNANFLNKYGYSQQEIQAVVDHRTFDIINKARLYDELKSQQNNTIKLVQKAPVRVERAGSVAPSNNLNIANAKMRLAETGSVEDAASLLEAFL
jgi:hypothetical protein